MLEFSTDRQDVQGFRKMASGENEYCPALEAVLRASVLEAENGIGAYGQNPVQASLIHVKWAIETHGIASQKVGYILNKTHETFIDDIDHRSNQKVIFLFVLRAFRNENTSRQLADMFRKGLGVEWMLMADLYSSMNSERKKVTLAELKRVTSGLSCILQCKLLTSDSDVQIILFRMASLVFREERSPLRSLSQAEVLVRENKAT